jgi:membrane protease YdiL (CAAX protease family)
LASTFKNSTDRTLAAWEIVSVVSSCLIAEWVILAFVGQIKLVAAIPIALALLFMIFSHSERGEGFIELGFRLDNFAAAIRLLIIPTLGGVILILAVAWLIRGKHFSLAPLRPRFLGLFFWALFQQYALQAFINRRAQIVFGKGMKSILLVGIIFGLLHLPNPLLTALTWIGGVVWAAVYQRWPNLYALALSHAIVSLTLALCLTQDLVYNLRVGWKYFG